MMNLLNGSDGDGLRWTSVGSKYEDTIDKMITNCENDSWSNVDRINEMSVRTNQWASVDRNNEQSARTTQRPNSRFIREKNDIEVLTF
jgi:hypothetical protein